MFSSFTTNPKSTDPFNWDQAKRKANEVCKSCYETAESVYQTVNRKIKSIAIDSIANKSYEAATSIEMGFNVAACIPIVGAAFSSVRVLAGYVQLTAGCILFIAEKIRIIASQSFGSPDTRALKKWDSISNLGEKHILHGALNVLRGQSELIVSTVTFGIGNIFFLVPNLSSKEPFAPFVPYESK